MASCDLFPTVLEPAIVFGFWICSSPEGGPAIMEADSLNFIFQKSPTLRRLSSWLPTASTVAIGPMR